MTEPEGLPGELEVLLEAERDIEAPSPAARARMLERLGPIVIPGAIGAGLGAAAASAGSSAETAATGKAAGALGAGVKAKLIVAAIAGAVGAVGGALTHAALTSPPAPKPVAAVVASVRVTPPPPASGPSPPLEPESSTPAVATPSPAAPSPPRSAGNSSANLRAERLLLERATAALMRGDASSALVALREHALRFPHGELAEEREVLLVRALRAAGQNDAADRRARDFQQKFPSSLQSGALGKPAPSP